MFQIIAVKQLQQGAYINWEQCYLTFLLLFVYKLHVVVRHINSLFSTFFTRLYACGLYSDHLFVSCVVVSTRAVNYTLTLLNVSWSVSFLCVQAVCATLLSMPRYPLACYPLTCFVSTLKSTQSKVARREVLETRIQTCDLNSLPLFFFK